MLFILMEVNINFLFAQEQALGVARLEANRKKDTSLRNEKTRGQKI